MLFIGECGSFVLFRVLGRFIKVSLKLVMFVSIWGLVVVVLLVVWVLGVSVCEVKWCIFLWLMCCFLDNFRLIGKLVDMVFL